MIARALAAALLVALPAWPAAAQTRPNVVLIYADDLGYGDVSAYGAKRIATPNIDRLAREGLRFTDAHAAAATCTPSRYAMLTGEYAWRTPGTGILPGDAALIIEPDRTTLASLFTRAGYATGVVGKWHLGLGPAGGPDWNGEIRPGPQDVGFGSAFVMAATGDRVPTVYVENRRVVGLDPADPIRVSYATPIGDWPTGRAHPDRLTLHPSHGHDQTIVDGVSRIGYMSGGKAALWKDQDMADTFTRKATAFIDRHKAGPFFLFFAPHDPHVPRVPHPRFAGATTMGPRGDAIAQLDWSVGEVLKALDRLQLTRDTIVIFTSDNGPVIDDGYRDDAVAKLGDHTPAGPFRGGKYSNFEGGTRVPMLVRWPARVKAAVSAALVSQVDLVASFAALLGTAFVPSARDSENVLPALLGTASTGRALLVEQAGALSLRRGSWKYIAPGKGPKVDRNTATELGNDAQPQLYDLSRDPGERTNLAASQPERVREMAAALERIRAGQAVNAKASPNAPGGSPGSSCCW
jgi:arylsulfatase A-like enzyme